MCNIHVLDSIYTCIFFLSTLNNSITRTLVLNHQMHTHCGKSTEPISIPQCIVHLNALIYLLLPSTYYLLPTFHSIQISGCLITFLLFFLSLDLILEQENPFPWLTRICRRVIGKLTYKNGSRETFENKHPRGNASSIIVLNLNTIGISNWNGLT